MGDKVGIGQQTATATPALSAGALSTAVDRMSFAHDIVMMSDETLAIGVGAPSGQVRLTSASSLIPFSNSNISNQQIQEHTYKDPLRELILITENPASKVDETYASTLAKEASVLSHVKEIHLETKSIMPKPTTLVTQPPVTLVPSEVKNLFQDKSDLIDPVKEKEFLMKISAVEESDTEGFMNVERPILGKVSLMRRAKSAVSRSIIERRINDKHPLFSVAWEHQKQAAKGSARQDSQTININVDDDDDAEHGSDDDIPTPEEVKRHMELFHLRRGQPPPSAKLEESRKSKHSKSRSTKTKSNR